MRRLRRGGVCALALGLAGVVRVALACGGGNDRVVPENAVQPPGASFEGQPPVGRTQQIQIVKEAMAASTRVTVRAPVRSMAQMSCRTVERLSVRAIEALIAGQTSPDALSRRFGLRPRGRLGRPAGPGPVDALVVERGVDPSTGQPDRVRLVPD